MPVWLQDNPKKSLMQHYRARGKMFCFPLDDLIYNGNAGTSIFKPVWSDGCMDYRISQKAPGWHGSRCSDMDHEALCEVLKKEQGCSAAGLALTFLTSSN